MCCTVLCVKVKVYCWIHAYEDNTSCVSVFQVWFDSINRRVRHDTKDSLGSDPNPLSYIYNFETGKTIWTLHRSYVITYRTMKSEFLIVAHQTQIIRLCIKVMSNTGILLCVLDVCSHHSAPTSKSCLPKLVISRPLVLALGTSRLHLVSMWHLL